jgi:hypothetical protein
MAGKVFCHEEIKVHREADAIYKRRLKLFYSIEYAGFYGILMARLKEWFEMASLWCTFAQIL